MVFDLGPGPPADILDCAETALLIHDTLASRDLVSLAKVSGSRGIRFTFRSTGGPATTGPEVSLIHWPGPSRQELPDQIVSRMTKSLRKGKDPDRLEPELRAQDHRLGVLHAGQEHPSVSMPVGWGATRAGARPLGRLAAPLRAREVLRRISGTDPFGAILELKQKLPG